MLNVLHRLSWMPVEFFNNEIQFNVDKGTMAGNPLVSQAASVLHVTSSDAG